MALFARLSALIARSLAVRWVIYVTSAATLGMAALLIVTSTKMEAQLDAQSTTVRDLARQKAAERIDAEIKLVEARLAIVFQALERNLFSVAGLRATQAAVESANDVAIAEEIGQRLVRYGFSGALVLDKRGSVIGADRTGVGLVAADAALKLHDLFGSYRQLLEDNAGAPNPVHRFIGTFDPSLATILLAPVTDSYGIILATPIVNDFAEPIGVIIAYRTIALSEPSLASFAETTGSMIALMVQDHPVSIARLNIGQFSLLPEESGALLSAPELQASARCQPSFPSLTICLMRPKAEIERFSDEIMAIGRQQFARTRTTLLSIGGLSLLLIILLLVILGRRLTRPLSEITQAVDLVARGEWRVEVLHVDREDEIGQIARAVSSMQVSLAERDRMRQEMVRIDAVNQRRVVLGRAVARFEDGMAIVTKNVGDTVRSLANTNTVLETAARRVGDQAETIRRTSLITAGKTSIASQTTIELGRAIRLISRRVRTTRDVVFESEAQASAVEERLGEVASVAEQAEAAIATLQGFIADLGHLSLTASLEAINAGAGSTQIASVAQSFNQIATKLAETAGIVTRELGRLGSIADLASNEIGEVKGVLGRALQETAEISVVVEEQDAVTREIAEGLTTSADALLNLAGAVDQLRDSLTSAHEATADFISTARRITDDAKSIDSSVRTFVRAVVA